MPYIGNDVVDLTHPANAQKSMDLRFLKKILTDTEIEQVQNSGNPDERLWSFWACKEAAYKVIQKKTGDAAFVPRRWSVHYRIFSKSVAGCGSFPDHYREGEVAPSGGDPVYFRLFTCGTYVHCLAADVPGAIHQMIARVESFPDEVDDGPADPSSFVRMKLIRSLACDLHRPEQDLRIVRERKDGGLGPPALYIAGAASNIDLSISHDGQYAAYAYII